MPDEVIDLTGDGLPAVVEERRRVSLRTAVDHLIIELLRAISVALVAVIGAATARALIYIAQ